MAHVVMTPVIAVSASVQEDRWFSRNSGGRKERRKKIDAKVQGLVQIKIFGCSGSLVISAEVPRCVWTDIDTVPLGLMPCGTESWMNAVMQIVVRLSILRMIFSVLTPQSYEPLQRFIEQYEMDRESQVLISSACSRSVVRCLAQKLPLTADCLSSHLFTIFQIFFEELGSPRHEACPFNEHCHLLPWDVEQIDLVSLIQQKLGAFLVSHVLVFLKKNILLSSCVPKHISDEGKGGYYDLQGFIERRKDGERVELIAYVKVKGKNWYQCRNQRIVKLHSIYLDPPLLSGCLFYYKRVSLRDYL